MRKKEDSGKYILENHLRTWSELRRERQAATAGKSLTLNTTEKEREKERKLLGGGEPASASPASPQIPVRKKWGGCPNGCDHGKHHYHKKGDNSMRTISSNNIKASSPTVKDGEVLPLRRSNTARRWQSSSEDEDDPRGRLGPPQTLDVQKSLDEVVSSPDGTPSFISVDDRLRVKSPKNDVPIKAAGRDFGGSKSGNTTQAGSDTEFSPAEQKLKKNRGSKKKTVPGTSNGIEKRRGREESGMGRGAMADALGDQSDADSGGSEADLDVKRVKHLDQEEAEEKSVRGSVY